MVFHFKSIFSFYNWTIDCPRLCMERYYMKHLPQLAKAILNHETIDKKYEYETAFFFKYG